MNIPLWQRRAFIILIAALAVTGLAQMPIFKRYYVADVPGLGWLAQYYVTLALHYGAAALFLALAGYRAALWLLVHRRTMQMTASGMLRIALLTGIVATGIARVVKNLPSWFFDPLTTMLVDWTHLGLALLLGAVALGARLSGNGRYLTARSGEPDRHGMPRDQGDPVGASRQGGAMRNCLRSPTSSFTAFAYMAVTVALLSLLMASVAFGAKEDDSTKTYGAAEAKKVVAAPKRWITADHSRHEALKKEFATPEEVTQACLSCHNEAAEQIHKTIHWTWKCPHDPEQKMGKYGTTINNFCVAVQSNEPRCTSCHIGYGFKDNTFDFTRQDKVDCLVCHEQTGTYKKFPTMAGYPVKEPKKFGKKKMFYPPDYNRVAQSVGRPSRQNCGVCHFFGGGGDGVKHGDLDSSMFKPSKELDVHMNAEGANFDCVRCHTTEAHKIAGRCYKKPAAEDRRSLIDDDRIKRIACESCHTSTPHEPGSKANDHTDKVACQSCHIPAYARVKPTKMWWDWSKAGKKKDGKPYAEKGPLGQDVYNSKKGEFVWSKNVTPEYFWFNGTILYTTLEDTIDPAAGPVKVNWPDGSRDNPNSRIYPFKVHRGKQPYDKVNNKLVVPHLFGKDKMAYWKSYDWGKAITAGMQSVNMEYSGEYDFIESEYHYPTTHMVAPKEKSLDCSECHAKSGRLANLAGFYMPGRDANDGIDTFGWLLVFGSIAGVLCHGLLRFFASKNNGS